MRRNVILMGRYCLVASYYDRNSRSFINEKVIRVNGVSLDKLYEIDRFTADKSNYVLWDIIKKDNDVWGLDTLLIKYIMNNEERPVYCRVIMHNEAIFSCCNSLKLKVFHEKRNHAYGIMQDNYFYNVEKKELEKLMENKDIDKLEGLLYNNRYLLNLIKRYFNSYYEYSEQEAKNRDYDLIFEEFSRYITFRNWIIAKEKTKDRGINRYSYDYNKDKRRVRKGGSSPKIDSMTDKDLDKMFDEKAMKECGMNYVGKICHTCNTFDVNNGGDEEFLEPGEMKDMGYDDSDELEQMGYVRTLRP
jgi:hypothetical protein